jgi:3-oxoacyl-[acyl-carrier protein] reductase
MTGKVPFLMRNAGRVVSALVQSGYPADIAEAALFLSSPASVGLNGHTIRVCGGHIVGA